MIRVADYIISKIKEYGIRHIFMITGRGILFLTDAVAKEKELVPVSTFHEQGASYAAMAYAAASDGMAACLVSTGCAAANAVTAALCAFQDNLPIVFISGNNPREENTRYTGLPIRTYGSQEADIVRIVEPITKYAVMIEDAGSITTELQKAISMANEGRKGPVWIDVPLDVQNMRVDYEDSVFSACESGKRTSSINMHEEVEAVLLDLKTAERPILLIGGGAKECREEISALAEQYNYPVAFSPSAATVYGSSHERSVGAVGSLGGSRAGNFAVQNADYVLAVGTKLCSQETGMRDKFARNAKIVAVDIDENEHRKKGLTYERVIIADSKSFLRALLDSKPKKASDSWINKCIHWKKVFDVSKEPFVNELKAKNELDLYSIAELLSDSLPKDATVITDAGFEELIIPSAIKYSDDQKCLFPAAQGAMGYAIPAILGAFFAGRKNIICIVGDGSFMMNMQELQIIKSYNVPAKIFVINNNMYAVIRKRQKDLFKNRTIGNDPSDGVPKPDFRAISSAFGIDYRLINSRPKFEKYTEESLCNDKLEMVEVICTSEQKYLHESYGLSEKKKLVHRPIEDMAPFLDREMIKNEMIIDMQEE